jgi:hypothetical protein
MHLMVACCRCRRAFNGDNFMALMYQIVQGTVPSIPADSQYSGQLVQLVALMMQRDAAARPSLPEVRHAEAAKQCLSAESDAPAAHVPCGADASTWCDQLTSASTRPHA